MFANKVVLVTGGSAGIGAAAVQLFAKEGASVALVGRSKEKLNAVAKRCQEYGAKTLAIRADISKQEEVQTIVKQTTEKFGKLDVLVNNAGIFQSGPIAAPNLLESYDVNMNTNLRPVVQITSLAIPHLIETKGSIINVSSVVSISCKLHGVTPYSMSKAAMDSFTRGAAMELAKYGIRVNAVNPGPTTTEFSRNTNDAANFDKDEFLKKITALGRSADAGEIADMILYLASNRARSITGSCYVIDNGSLLK